MSHANNRSSGAQQRFRTAVLARANGYCEGCGELQEKPWTLIAHHIVPKAEGGKSGRTGADNGLALCRACHERAHGEVRTGRRRARRLAERPL